ncbi:MAG TPA: DinB family protein [Pyrinomonadaceae bacterium]|nr:DinB family protein [Pyrinomonadaceae bacterium]
MTAMNIKDFLVAELNREIERSRRALEQAPKGKYDWKPHDKSMIFGYLANMVATIPMWITMQLNQDELDIAPKDGSKFEQKRLDSSVELVEALDKAAAGARAAFEQTSDEHLKTNWQLKRAGDVVMEAPRYEMIQDTLLHWAHHRGQMTVYLRLMSAKVPALYGPSADESGF